MITEFNGNIAYNVEIGHIFVIGGRTIDGASKYIIINYNKNLNYNYQI